MTEIIDFLKKYTDGKKNIEKVEISVLQLNRVIKALEKEPILDKIRVEIEQLPTKTRINWNGCCPDINYPKIEYVDISKNKLLSIIDKYKVESECEK